MDYLQSIKCAPTQASHVASCMHGCMQFSASHLHSVVRRTRGQARLSRVTVLYRRLAHLLAPCWLLHLSTRSRSTTFIQSANLFAALPMQYTFAPTRAAHYESGGHAAS